MFFTLITSELDLASKTMLGYLQEYKKFIELKNFCFTSLLYDNISIYVSKNQLKSRIPSLTCHFPGNYFTNSYGGNKSELGIAYPSLQKNYLKKIYQSREKVPFCDITIETTHHGPTTLKKPAMFVEIGSSEDQWSNMNI